VSYPDCHFTLEEMIVAGDRLIVRYTWEGTSKGESIVAGTPPTGKHGAMAGIWIDRYEGDKVVETWVVQDTLGLMQQLSYVLVQKET
jgi:predicted ester cyclase